MTPDGQPDLSAYLWIDFETRSACDLRKYGGRIYAAHRSTQVICGSAIWYEGDEERTCEWHHETGIALTENVLAMPPRALPATVVEAMRARVLVAANADGFDRHIAHHYYGIPPELDRWRDMQHTARRLGYPPALEKLGQLLLGHGKNEEGGKLIRMFSLPIRGTSTFARFSPVTLGKMVRYCTDDTRLMHDLDVQFLLPYEGESGERELAVVEQHRVQMDRGVAFDVDLARAILAADAENQARIRARIDELTGGELTERDLNSEAKVKKWLKAKGFEPRDPVTGKVSLAKKVIEPLLAGELDEEEGDEDAPPLDPAVITILRARLGVSRVTSGKLETGLGLVGPDGRVRDTTVYHGAHTGRWAGRGVQVQNLPRGEVDQQAIDEAVAILLQVKE